jgi:hypothetical protein
MPRKKKKIELQYGETPWSTMPREELEREMQKAYFALIQTTTALNMCRYSIDPNKDHPYFTLKGSGGSALANANDVFAPYREKYEDPEFYGCYFRAASTLLFPSRKDYMWSNCPVCHEMRQSQSYEETAKDVGKPCRYSTGCTGVVEWLTWENYGVRKTAVKKRKS